MKKFFTLITIAIAITACTNDDRYTWDDDFADRTATDTINIGIRWNGTSVTGSSFMTCMADSLNTSSMERSPSERCFPEAP